MRRYSPFLLLLISALFLYIAFTNITDAIALLRTKSTVHEESFSLQLSSTLLHIDRALKTKVNNIHIQYNGLFESPFRSYAAQAQSNSGSGTVAPVNRKKLFLKGILIKSSPLAILEDEYGTTYIRGTGDSALDQHVTQIKTNSVVLRDKRGSYELSVEEK